MSTSSAREHLAQERERERQAARKKKAFWVILVVLALVLGTVAALWSTGQDKRKEAAETVPVGAELAHAVSHFDAKVFDQVGVGSSTTPPESIPGGKPVLVDGKPKVLYIGAEFCPFCGMQRLSLAAALSRFGTFEGLKDGLTSPNEGQLSNIPTIFFNDTKFTSESVAFTGVEVADRMGQPLQTQPTAEDAAIMSKFAPKGGIPFVFYGSAYSNWAGMDGEFLAGRTSADVVAKLADPNSPETQAIVGEANVITAQICRETGNKPADVCNSAGAKAGATKLK